MIWTRDFGVVKKQYTLPRWKACSGDKVKNRARVRQGVVQGRGRAPAGDGVEAVLGSGWVRRRGIKNGGGGVSTGRGGSRPEATRERGWEWGHSPLKYSAMKPAYSMVSSDEKTTLRTLPDDSVVSSVRFPQISDIRTPVASVPGRYRVRSEARTPKHTHAHVVSRVKKRVLPRALLRRGSPGQHHTRFPLLTGAVRGVSHERGANPPVSVDTVAHTTLLCAHTHTHTHTHTH